MTVIYLNGRPVGHTKKPETIVNKLREMRRKGKLHKKISIAYNSLLDEILINTDAGRVCRPLIIVKNGKPLITDKHLQLLKSNKLTIDDLVSQGLIEYLDAEEEENAYIALTEDALTPEHTHLEIDALGIFGVCAGRIPYLEHNQASRDNLGANMSKQALGVYAINYMNRADTQTHILHYSQTPLVKTHAYDAIGLSKRPAGQNLVVAILCGDGYNMQDAILINKGVLDRGALRSTFYRTYVVEALRYPGGQQDSIHIPPEDVSGYRGEKAYRFLDPDGIVNIECEVKSADVLVGKSSPPRFLESLEEFGISTVKRRETSAAVKHGEEGIVDLVVVSETEDGNKLIKVKVRDTRIPEIGDKFASRHGQKGVLGLIVPTVDFPFTANGLIPDIIINPHTIPSRMTIAQLLEMIGGKVAALRGKIVDGTPFSNEPESELRAILKAHGFRNTGKEVMYDGLTGEMYQVEIFIGIAYYQKLKHMVKDKIRARSRGPVQVLTRQPTEGKAREGGLRIGEMEKDCLVAHGTSLLLQERMLRGSDLSLVPICAKCGMSAIHDKYRDIKYCSLCGEHTNIVHVEMSYAFKLLLDELKSLLIYPKIEVKEI